MNGVLHFETTSVERRLTDFLDYQKLINNADEVEVEPDKITLMTLHAAKGTEFPVVFILGHGGRDIPDSAPRSATIRT